MAGKTELNNKCKELSGQVDEYEKKISVISSAILATKTKKSQLTVARGDLKAARTWVQESIESFKENYYGSDTAERKLAEMKDLKGNMKQEYNTLQELIDNCDTALGKLNDLKSKYETELQNCKIKLSEAKVQLAKLNNP